MTEIYKVIGKVTKDNKANTVLFYQEETIVDNFNEANRVYAEVNEKVQEFVDFKALEPKKHTSIVEIFNPKITCEGKITNEYADRKRIASLYIFRDESKVPKSIFK